MYSAASEYFYSAASTDQPNLRNPLLIPVETPSDKTLTPIPVHLPPSYLAASAVKIQAAYRGHLVRSFVRTILSVDADARRIERRIQRQETVDAIRDENSVERVRLNELLMKSLLRLDSVPGFYPAVRELRRNLSRRIVGLQELLDWIVMWKFFVKDGRNGADLILVL
ncbi:hypothetical protein LUZ60_000014 [Juncus effusus]|nr:hypothetical protein LUZ60_000014 [Juncus effusus]